MYVFATSERWAASTSQRASEARSEPPRASTTRLSGTSEARRFCIRTSFRPCGIRRPLPPVTRSGSTSPQSALPSPTERLSPVTRPPPAISPNRTVDRPMPLGAVSIGLPPAAMHADACRGARPRVPAHQSTGYCNRIDRASRWNRDRRMRATARSRAGGRQRYVNSAPSGEHRRCRSNPAVQTFWITASPFRRQAPRVSSSQPRVSNAELLDSTRT